MCGFDFPVRFLSPAWLILGHVPRKLNPEANKVIWTEARVDLCHYRPAVRDMDAEHTARFLPEVQEYGFVGMTRLMR
jgi:hypothetical protein